MLTYNVEFFLTFIFVNETTLIFYFILLLLYYRVNSWTNRVELYIAQVQFIYLTNLIFSSSSACLVHEPSSTNKLSSRVPNYIQVGSVYCQPYLTCLVMYFATKSDIAALRSIPAFWFGCLCKGSPPSLFFFRFLETKTHLLMMKLWMFWKTLM